MPLFFFNPTTAFMVHVSSFWFLMVWDKGELLSILPSSVIEQILLVLISSVGSDMLHWTLSGDGDFSLMTLGSLFVSLGPRMRSFSFIWPQHILSRVSFLLWCLLHSFLVTDDALCLRGFYMAFDVIVVRLLRLSGTYFWICPVVRQI